MTGKHGNVGKAETEPWFICRLYHFILAILAPNWQVLPRKEQETTIRKCRMNSSLHGLCTFVIGVVFKARSVFTILAFCRLGLFAGMRAVTVY